MIAASRTRSIYQRSVARSHNGITSISRLELMHCYGTRLGEDVDIEGGWSTSADSTV